VTDGTESKLKDWGLLLLRLGIGGMFAYLHGWDKMTGGPEKWAGSGDAMKHLGITFLPAFWGFMAAFAESVGGICVMLGLFFRPMAAMIAFTMFVAATMHYSVPAMRKGLEYPAVLCLVMAALVVTGPGRFALGRLLFGGKTSRKKTA
jgi:putative oxidoreductase